MLVRTNSGCISCRGLFLTLTLTLNQKHRTGFAPRTCFRRWRASATRWRLDERLALSPVGTAVDLRDELNHFVFRGAPVHREEFAAISGS